MKSRSENVTKKLCSKGWLLMRAALLFLAARNGSLELVLNIEQLFRLSIATI